MAVPFRPELFLGVAFNADPFEVGPAATPVWSDLTLRCYQIGAASRGRQYELDQNQTGALNVIWHNADEALNPNNPASPYAPNVVPYRQILVRAMWPNGGTGNLLNLAYNATDASFESYVNGAAAPAWLTRVGGVTPTITTTTPQQGTKDVTYAVAATATAQGLAWSAPCIPGRTYTASAYVRQSTASTQQLTASGFYAYDTYDRTVSGGLGTTTSGQSYALTGTPADFSVTGTAARIATTTINLLYYGTLDTGSADHTVQIQETLPVLPTGANFTLRTVGRWSDANNFYEAQVQIAPSGVATLLLSKRVLGTGAAIGGSTVVGTHVAGNAWTIVLDVRGSVLQARAWNATTGSDPVAWQLTATGQTELTAGTSVGAGCRRDTGNTNGVTNVDLDNLTVLYNATGTSTTTTGAYTRLACTFVAQQPTHLVQLVTSGTAVAGTVNVDALQHEPGGAATAFTTVGPLIRNVWTRGYVERWPNQWVDVGFRGVSVTPCVGPFAILANADLHTEMSGAIRAKIPTYYWALQEASTATVFAESSGNSGPPLVRANSPIGPGVFAPATTMGVVGDVDGVGVRTAPTAGQETLLNVPFTCLQAGYSGPTLTGPSAAPGNSATSWGSSMVFLLTRPAIGANGSTFVRFVDYNNVVAVGVGGVSGSQLSAGGAGALVADTWGNNLPHLYAVVTTMAGGNLTTTLYVDGTQVTTTTIGPFPNGQAFPTFAVSVGGAITFTFNQAWQDQTVSHLGYWNRALTAAEVTDLGAAFKGYAGETSGARISRQLGLGGYNGPAAIQAGASIMGPSTVKEKDPLLGTCQRNADSEFGNFFESGDGVAFSARTTRYLATTSVYTFGERVDLGEYPYEGTVTFDTDPQLVLNIADVTRSGGVVAHAEDITGVSQKRHGKKNFTRTIDTASDNETQDAATWTVSNRKDPLTRVASITFNPAAVAVPFGDGSLWPMVLTLEIGTRVTVKRRPKAANGGSGITMSGDFFVESISHHDIVPAAGTWSTTLLLSPVSRAQPWILEHATYGVLDQTTVLGF